MNDDRRREGPGAHGQGSREGGGQGSDTWGSQGPGHGHRGHGHHGDGHHGHGHHGHGPHGHGPHGHGPHGHGEGHGGGRGGPDGTEFLQLELSQVLAGEAQQLVRHVALDLMRDVLRQELDARIGDRLRAVARVVAEEAALDFEANLGIEAALTARREGGEGLRDRVRAAAQAASAPAATAAAPPAPAGRAKRRGRRR